jgi:hypothetical protein
MLKTISAALLAVSFIAAPALAADSAKDSVKNVQAPAAKTMQAPAAKTAVIKPAPTKPSVMNANAKMGGHHAKHHRHHRHHSKMGVLKTHSKIGFKQAAPATKRG